MGFKFTRVLQFNFEDEEGFGVDKITGKDIVELAERIGANTITFFARDAWGRAFYNSKVLPKIAKLGNRDLLKEIVEEAKRRGIHVVAMIGHTTNPVLYGKHPDWAQVDREGRVITMDTDPKRVKREKMTWPLMCLNSPFLEVVKKEAEEVLRYGVDGVFLDSFRYMPDADRACFCERCRSKFKEEMGYELSREEDVENDAYRRSFEWRINVNTNSIKEIKKALESLGKGAFLIYNNHPLAWRGRANTIAEKSRDFVDAFFAECSEVDYQPPGFIAEMVKLTRALTGKPVWASRNSFHTALTSQTTSPLTIRMGIREAFAGGGWPLFLVFASTFLNGVDTKPVREAFEEVAKLEEYMDGAKPLPYVGIVWSNRSRDWAGKDLSPHIADSFRGFYYALLKEGLPVNYISDTMLDSGNFMDYKAIVLANTQSLSSNAVQNLKKYMEKNGGIIATYKAGSKDEKGRFLEETQLSRILGVRFNGLVKTNWSYMKTLDIDHPVLLGERNKTILMGDFDKEFVDKRVPPELGWNVATEPGDGQVLAKIVMPTREFGNEYENGRSPPPPIIETDLPAIVSGERWVYFSGQIGRIYWRTGMPSLHSIILNSIFYTAGPPPIMADTKGFVELEAYTRDGQILVHLLNQTYADRLIIRGNTNVNTMWTSTPESVHPPSRVVPLPDLKLVLRGIDVNKVYEPLTGKSIEFKKSREFITVKVPLEEYRFLVIEVK